MRRHDVIRGLGLLRVGVGASLVAAPRLAGRIWVGDDAGGHGTRVFARALGARDVGLGLTTLQRLGEGDDVGAARLTQLGVMADAADLVATVIARRNLSGPRRWLMPLVAAAVGALGTSVWWLAEEAVHEVEQETAPDAATDGGPTGDPGAATPVIDAGRIDLDDQRRATLEEVQVQPVIG